MTIFKAANTLAVTALMLTTLASCQTEDTASFAQDVKPILDRYCVECHLTGGKGFEQSGFSMDSYDALMKGAANGPMIIPGDPSGQQSTRIDGGARRSVHSHATRQIRAGDHRGSRDHKALDQPGRPK